MSRNYDNWERLVAAVIRKEQLWQLFHEDSRSPSLRSEASSSTSSSYRYLDSPLHDLPSFSGSFHEDSRSPSLRSEASTSSSSSSFRYLGFPFNNLPSFSGSFHEVSRSPSLRYEASSFTSSSFRYFDSHLHDLQPKLVFISNSSPVFDFEDLVRAYPKVLSNAKFKTTYKADMDNGVTVVVMQLKLLSVTEAEFKKHMELVQNIRHKNIVELRAYFYSKDKKLVLYDHYGNGSVSDLLHGCRSFKSNLTWETRRRVAVGAARGIAYIHTRDGMKLVHGNIKASNIFFNDEEYGCVADVGLSMFTSQMTVPVKEADGYRAPEVTHTKTVSQASDVYSFGVVLLELVTGMKSEIISRVVSLVTWIQSEFLDEEWSIDRNLPMDQSYKKGIKRLLQIVMDCVSICPEDRPKMPEVVKMLEEISEFNKSFYPKYAIKYLKYIN